MIFLTVGTIFPFDRLTRAVDAWARETGRGADIFGQIGDIRDENYRPVAFDWVERLSPVDFRTRVKTADVIVSHAGIGTLIEALTRAKPVLILPRRSDLREIVNDHQFETIRRFGNRPGVHVAADETEIGPALDRLQDAPQPEPLGPYAQDSLIAAIRAEIHGF